MKYLLFFILFSSSGHAFDIFDPLDFKSAALVENSGTTVGKMDLYLENETCSVEVDLKKKTISYFSFSRLTLPFKTVEFKDLSSNPILKTLSSTETWAIPISRERITFKFDDNNKLSSVTTYQNYSWKPSHTYTCNFLK